MSAADSLRNGLQTARDAAAEAEKSTGLVFQLLRAGHTQKAKETAESAARQSATTSFLLGEYLAELDEEGDP